MNTQKFDPALGLWNIWNISNVAEKRNIMTAFLQENGDHYTHDDFVSFLNKKYHALESIHTVKTATGEQKEH